MCKVEQKECVVNSLDAKTNLTYFPKILQFTQMLKRFGMWKQKFTNLQKMLKRFGMWKQKFTNFQSVK